ncbi:MAG: alpha/beta hydrolase [Rhodospirillales bacterium]
MAELPRLDGPSLGPASGGAPRQLAILLHGVGADGNDLLGLAPHFQGALPDALFLSPHAPFSFDMAPVGYQWFSLRDSTPEARLAGVRAAAPILDAFIDARLAEHGLGEDRVVLIGFSQGTMMALHVGLRRQRRLAGIVGYSGMLAGAEALAGEVRAKPPVLLVHGDADPVIPVQALPAAVAGLEAAGIRVDSHICPGLGHGIDAEGVRLGVDFAAGLFGAGST